MARRLRGGTHQEDPFQHEVFDHERTLIQFSVGTLPHDRMMRSIELFGTEVAPAVRKALAATPAGA